VRPIYRPARHPNKFLVRLSGIHRIRPYKLALLMYDRPGSNDLPPVTASVCSTYVTWSPRYCLQSAILIQDRHRQLCLPLRVFVIHAMKPSDETVSNSAIEATTHSIDETGHSCQIHDNFDEERSLSSVEIVFKLGGDSSESAPESFSSRPSVEQRPEEEASASTLSRERNAHVEKKTESPTKSALKASIGNDLTTRDGTSLFRVPLDGTTVHSGSLLDAKASLAAARARSVENSSIVLTDPEKAAASTASTTRDDRVLEGQLDHHSNLSVLLDERYTASDDELGMLAVIVSALAVSDNEVDEARAQVIREAREAFLAEAGHAEPVDQVNPMCSREHSVYMRLALALILVSIVGLAVGVSHRKSSQSQAGTPVEPATLSPTTTAPTSMPIIVLEDGRIAFSTRQQLYDAVDAYLLEVESGEFSNTSDVAALHGYPIGNWDVSRITNFDRVFVLKPRGRGTTRLHQ
jgi:hypothetical protein